MRIPRFHPGALALALALIAPGRLSAAPPATALAAATNAAAAPDISEQIRSNCMQNRRFIIGRVLEVRKDGLVIESGYTSLNRDPLNRSWVVPQNVSASLEPNAIEGNTPGATCFGTVLLLDFPKRPAVHKYDYVMLQAFPAGQYDYTPVPPIRKSIRKFSGSLEMAVNRLLADSSK